ncbi:MAG: hypothetical protein FJ291_33930, partial [Planctomycetes bacterium]|nr:hypothetical protein [Planctomycetota bacterium]
MADRDSESNGVLSPAGLAVTFAGLLVTGVGFAVFARMAKQPTATGTPGLMALVSLAVGVVLVEAGSWMNAAFYRSLEKAPYRGWVEIAGGVALILGVLVLGNFLAFYWLGTSAMPVAGIVLGLVLLELALVAEHRTVIRVCTGPAFPLTMIVLGAALLGIVALGLISYINQRHYRRADLTRTGIYTLSDETLKLLMEVKKPLRVISTMVRAARADSDEERPRNFIRGKVGELLEEYQSQSRQIEYIPLDIYANP